MQITDVRVFPVRDDKLKAFVSVVFEGCFMVNDIKVINGRDGYFISMPSRRKKNGEFKDIAHPLNTDTRRLIEKRILDEYEQVVALEDPPVRRYDQERSGGSDTESPRPAAASKAQPEPEPARAEVAKPRDQPAAEPQPRQQQPPEDSKAAGTSEDPDRRDLDEVVEDHLSDSFWS